MFLSCYAAFNIKACQLYFSSQLCIRPAPSACGLGLKYLYPRTGNGLIYLAFLQHESSIGCANETETCQMNT